MMEKKRNQKKAFTLVELLAVIVILGLLAILTFPKILEMVNNKEADIDKAKLNLLYSATKSYLFDNQNKYPARAGNTFCVSPKELEIQGYVPFDVDELSSSSIIKVSYFDANDFELAYVSSSDCTNTGVVDTNLTGLSCLASTSGYSISKTVTVTYPISDDFIYLYSLDNGKTWKEVKDFDSENKLFFHFYQNGSLLAKVKVKDSTSYISCSIFIDQIDPTPIGTVVAYAGKSVPQGYLLADGSAISRSKYYDLYNVLVSTYGTSSNSKTFNLPNLLGKTVVGLDKSDPDFALGFASGEKNHTLTVAEMPAHSHTFTGSSVTSSASGAHTHTFSGTTSVGGSHSHSFPSYSSSGTGENSYSGLTWNANAIQVTDKAGLSIISAGAHTHTISGTTSGKSANHTHNFTAKGTNSNIGGGQAHSNLMPYSTVNFIIKYQ